MNGITKSSFGTTNRCDHENGLIKRSDSDMTPEQKFCGKWEDCPYCWYTRLVPSDELKKFLEGQKEWE